MTPPIATTCFAFTIEGRQYALPLEAVDEALPMAWVTPVAESPEDVRGVLDVRGTAVTVVDVAVRLAAAVREATPADFLVLVHSRSGRLALRVDALVGLVTGPLEPPPANAQGPSYVAGLLRNADGLVTVLALEDFLRPEVRAFAQRLREQGRPPT